ncbi:IPTL-CTERM sorting domain-containing protein [Ottowia sp. VDI28]|uniref:IPTL-CTERM sorting domain-containing protein n=1 Tax=Ottowia sp. VDI28 TaxID=3133968 RepID=UPI003C2D0F30
MSSGKMVRGLWAATALMVGGYAQAAYTAYIYQSGPNVTATGSGSINLAAMAYEGDDMVPPGVQPDPDIILLGAEGNISVYSGTVNGPGSIGSGGSAIFADAGTGPLAGIQGAYGLIAVPLSYVSGASLGASTATWNGTTIAGLGLVPGTYTWTWGSGSTADSFTLRIGVAPSTPTAVPALSELALIGLAALLSTVGMSRVRRRG